MAGSLRRPWGTGMYKSVDGRVQLVYENGTFWCVPKPDCVQFGEDWHVVMKEQGSFSLLGVSTSSSESYAYSKAHIYAELYFPIHSSMTREDIEGATHAWDDGTHWHFSHATPAEHHEFADFCETQALAAVQPILNDRIERYMVATTDGPIQVNARAEFQAWRAFAVQTQEFARKYALAEPLGHWARNLDLHHARNIVGRAMAGTLNKWGEARPDASEHNYYQKVRKEALKISLALQANPSETIKTWPTHRAEVAAAAEAAKKAEEAEDTSSDDTSSEESGE